MDIILTIVGLSIIALIVIAYAITEKNDWVYPDGKNGMVRIKPGVISANTDSPRWWNMFFRNVEM